MKQYTVILERGTRNWSAYVSDLPGCVAAGRTRTQTERLIREAIESHVDMIRAAGEPIPEPTTEALQVVVSA